MRQLVLTAVLLAPTAAAQTKPYFPTRTAWATKQPAEVGLDPARLATAVTFARGADIGWPTDVAEALKTTTAKEPYPEILGPTKPRAQTNGVVIRHGYIVAEWGDTRQVDMTFSVAKSYLSTVAGLAYDRGLIPDLAAPEGALVHDGGFDSPHNAKITWNMHLTQTSEWEGTLWDKPDVADRRLGYDRKLGEPGAVWEYNDVRVNRLALSLLRLFKKPLPEVFKESIADPIGMDDWVWHGYRNAWVEIEGRRMQSVSGGGHWGGGFWASTRDHAKFGLLALNHGNWAGRQLVSSKWFELATTPSRLKPVYGYLWWLNTDRKQFATAPATSFFALGAGGNVIWMDRDHELVVVVRWLDPTKTAEFMSLVQAAITD